MHVGAAAVFTCRPQAYIAALALLLPSCPHLKQDKSDTNKQLLLSDQLTSAQEHKQGQHTDSTACVTDPLQAVKPAVVSSADAPTAEHTQQTATSPRRTAAVGAVVAACSGAKGHSNAFGTLMAAAQSSKSGSKGSSSNKLSAEEMQQQADRYGPRYALHRAKRSIWMSAVPLSARLQLMNPAVTWAQLHTLFTLCAHILNGFHAPSLQEPSCSHRSSTSSSAGTATPPA
jgi:hypothetical protein